MNKGKGKGKKRAALQTTGSKQPGSSKRARRHEYNSQVDAQDDTACRETNTQTACGTVLSTTELLEQVLSFLPFKKIFIAQRVSKYWKDVIADSPDIQQKLFNRLSTKPRELWALFKRETRHSDPDSAETSGLTGVQEYSMQKVDQPQHYVYPYTWLIVDLNPMMTMDTGPFARRKLPAFKGVSQDFGIRGEIVCYTGTMDALKQRATMYLSDPPCLSASLGVTAFYRDADASATTFPIKVCMPGLDLRSATGLKVGHVLKAIASEKGSGCCIRSQDGRDLPHSASALGYQMALGSRMVTMYDLEHTVRRMHGWKRICRSDAVELVITLQPTDEVVPIVTSAAERNAVFGAEGYCVDKDYYRERQEWLD
jgi:hypothetical protein